jgi:hypothetical protein
MYVSIRYPRYLIAFFAVAFLSLTLQSCGGGGSSSGGSKYDDKRMTINKPMPGGAVFETIDYSVALSGNAFVWPKITDCPGIAPQPLTIQWRNKANGSSGIGESHVGCLCDMFACAPSSRWTIEFGLVPLKIGENLITITGTAGGKSQSASIKVVRLEGGTALAVTTTPGQMILGNTYPIEIKVLDSAGRGVPDQLIEWATQNAQVAGIHPESLSTDVAGLAEATVSARSVGEAEIVVHIAGTDISTTIKLTVNTSSNDTGQELPSKPILIRPINNSIISQSAPESCKDTSIYSFGHQINFDWSDSEATSEIVGYHLFVKHLGASLPTIQQFVAQSYFTHTKCSTRVIDSNLYDWEWHVRAEDAKGNLSPKSDVGVFQFAPCRMEDGSTCR